MRRHRHYLSHYRLFTCNMGQVVPIGCTEVLPGDTFRHSTSMLARVAPMVAPVMHPVHLRVHHWYVPHRLTWEDFDEFITNQDPELTVPKVTVPAERSYLLDHLGVDPAAVDLEVNALPIRAYNKIWNEFYRDQDLDEEVELDQLSLLNARWEKDYFTTARPSPQQGEDIAIPFSVGAAPITGLGLKQSGNYLPAVHSLVETDKPVRSVKTTSPDQARDNLIAEVDADNNPKIYADLSNATGGISVADMRTAFAMQRFAEARSRYGSRYADYLRFLGIRPSDGRLDRPEYLGGGKQTIAFSEVLATASTAEGTLGELAGHGIAAMRTRPYRRFFEEHGFVISLAIVRPKAIYAQVLSRHWLRNAKDDFWQKEMEVLGQQAVPRRELYPAHASGTDLFGYVDRYLEYRQAHSYVSGSFRDLDNSWHLARQFSEAPQLNSSFLECDGSNRIFADTNQQQLYVMAQHRIAARRLVAKRARLVT